MRAGLVNRSADALSSIKEIYDTWVIVKKAETSNG